MSKVRADVRRWKPALSSALVVGTAVVVLAAAGDLDTGFGSGGIVKSDSSVNYGYAAVCKVQSTDGKIVVGGYDAIGATYQHWRVRRYDYDGSLDTGFGTGGSFTAFGNVANGDQLIGLAIDSGGGIVAVGHAAVNVTTTGNGKKTTTTQMNLATVVRLRPDGTLDPTFGMGGAVSTNVPNSVSSRAVGVLVQSDGKIVVAGSATFGPFHGQYNTFEDAVFVARYNTNGSLDASFGTGGITVNDVNAHIDDRMYSHGALAMQSNGKILVGANYPSVIDNVAFDSWEITRYTASGAIDTAFGAVHSPIATDNTLEGLAVDSSDRIIALGERFYAINVSDMLTVRYTANGAVDTTFGTNGAAVVHDTSRGEGAGGPVIDANGKIVFTGRVYPNSPTTFEFQAVTVRLNSDGSPDATFGSGGVTAPIAIGNSWNNPWGLALSPDGRIVVAGTLISSGALNTHDWFVARYLAN